MNYLWAGMMLVAIVYGAVHGTIPEVTQAALDSSKEAVTLCITMLGILSFWMGLMQVASASGLIERMTRGIRPVLQWLFPRIPKGHPAMEQIAVNCIANILGLGWAATPAGLKAMEELKNLEEERRAAGGMSGNLPAVPKGVASDEMCVFLILNISSLQLIPMNVVAYRSQYGSVNPTAIVGPAILATAVSTLAGVIFCKVMDGKRRA
ncbi:MAG: nucleoside recognition protein [Lachnospiraceae bacterium]|jgi:spore maturation protein A|nr:nucleoside recognition protein [Lachnospiraceae bacterium]